MKVVAVFALACIAVTFAYPTIRKEDKIQIQEGTPMVYNREMNKWQPQANVQETCDEGIKY